VEACAQVSEELLRACPELHILDSSREALNIAGEMVFHVPALSLPAAGGLTSSETLLQYESVRLFTERAAVARSGFSLTSQNGPAVAQICRRLDGIPLALELAAARMKVLTAEQIAARLDDRFRLLVGGSRTALPRQQTLKTMIDWSYDLLSESEQVLLQRLSIFAGGWTLEAAEQVTGVEPLEPPAILDLLTQLVSKSLVTVDEHTGEARYHMLETILQYGREKLRTAGEQDMMNDRHLGYFVELAEKADLYIRGAEEKLWLDYLEAELDNLRQALSWVFERQNVPACLRLAGILPRFWQLRSYFIEGLESSEKMLALEAAIVIPAPPDSLIVVKARGLMEIAIFWQTAWLRMLSVDLNRSFELSKASLAIYQQLGDQRGQAAALRTIAQYSMDTNNIEEAQAAAKESLALAKAADDKWLMAEVLNNILGNCEDFLGDYKRANEYHAQGLALRKEIGDKDGAAWALLLLGMGELYQERYAQASKYLEEALQFSHAVGNTYITGTILCKLGPAAMGLGNLQAAGQFLTEGLKLNLTTNEKSYSLLCLNELGGLAGAQKQWERSARLLGFVSKQLEGVLPLLVGPGVHDRYVAAARAYMHETTFNAAWDAGQTMSLDEACAFALEETVS
jgi:predicted ATPase